MQAVNLSYISTEKTKYWKFEYQHNNCDRYANYFMMKLFQRRKAGMLRSLDMDKLSFDASIL